MDSFEPTEVTPRHIRRYLTYLKNERGNRPSTRNTKLAALGSYYLFLECYEYIKEEDNPTLLIKRARVPRRLPIFLTADEAKDLLIASTGVAEPERNLAIMRIMIQAGLRVQEIINLSNSPSFATHLFDSPITGRRGLDGLKKTGRSCNIKDNPVIPACNSRPVTKCYEEASVSVIL